MTAPGRTAGSNVRTDVILMPSTSPATRRERHDAHVVPGWSTGALLAAALAAAAAMELATILVTGSHGSGRWHLPVRSASGLIAHLVAHTDWIRLSLFTAVAIVVGVIGTRVADARR